MLAVALLVVAGVLVLTGSDDGDDGFTTQAAATCQEFGDRVQHEYELSFPEGAPTEAAQAEYLSHAFADTMDELVESLRAIDPPPDGDAATAIDALEQRIDEIRADPDAVVAAATDPFEETVNPQLDDAGLTACGSDFFEASQ